MVQPGNAGGDGNAERFILLAENFSQPPWLLVAGFLVRFLCWC
jgi:hypothetical protein